MASEENNEIVEEELSLSEYLKPDTPEILEIKSLYNMEYEYSEYLGTIEYAIADYYYNTYRELKDKDVISALKNIKQNYEKDISFFKSDLEILIVEDLLETLEEFPLSHHEFKLLFDYILWVIDNRSWVEDEQAYVKWTAYVLGLFSKEEEEDYEKQFKKITSEMGLTDAQADMLLLKKDADEFFEEGGLFEGREESEVLARETVAYDLETGFFLMTDDEKFDFLLENGPDYIDLVQSYISDLAEKEDFEKLQAFYKKLSEKEKNFFPLHLMMGTIYLGKDPAFAKSCFQETLRIVDTLEEIPKETKEDLRESISLLGKLIEKSEK
ncbi:MAG: hypothetical protein AB3K77_14975 [Methanosarcinaceae archaeon]